MAATIRRARIEDAPAIAAVHVASWRTTYQGILSDETLENLSEDRRTLLWQHELRDTKTVTFVAEDGQGRIVGFASGGPNRTDDDNPRETDRYHSEVYAIYLLQEVQRHGLGHQLMHAVVGDLRKHGYMSMILWVAEDNAPARKFYEASGGRYVSTHALELGGTIINEVSYGWDNIKTVSL